MAAGGGVDAIAAAFEAGYNESEARAILDAGGRYLCPDHRLDIRQIANDWSADATTTEPPTTAAPTTVVIYEVIGSGTALVTYGTAGFSQEQQTVTLPWRHEVRGDVPDFPVLVAQQDGSGEVTCKIWQGGTEPSAQATSNGAYAVVTCADD